MKAISSYVCCLPVDQFPNRTPGERASSSDNRVTSSCSNNESSRDTVHRRPFLYIRVTHYTSISFESDIATPVIL